MRKKSGRTKAITGRRLRHSFLATAIVMIAALVALVGVGAAIYAISGGKDPPPSEAVAATEVGPRTVSCPATRQVVDIGATSIGDQRLVLKDALATDGTTVRLGPGVELDFSDFPIDSLPLSFGRCVTLTSVRAFDDPVLAPEAEAGRIKAAGSTVPTVTEGRSPGEPGPVIRYGKARGRSADAVRHPVQRGRSGE